MHNLVVLDNIWLIKSKLKVDYLMICIICDTEYSEQINLSNVHYPQIWIIYYLKRDC